MTPRLLLVVEDDPGVTELVRASVHDLAAEVRVACDAGEAMKCFADSVPDLVILDLGLPDRDGLELLGDIRAASDVPVLILTGRVEPEDQETGLNLGADLYVTKPFSPGILRAKVAGMLRRAANPPTSDNPSAT